MKLSAIVSFFIGFLLIISFKSWASIANSFYAVEVIVLMLMAIAIAFKDQSRSLYYIFVISIYNIALFMFVFMIEGILENNDFIRYGFFFMLSIEVIVFALMLSNRYNELKDETIKIQTNLVKVKSLNQVVLENKILERTNEISKLLSDKDLLLKELHHRVKNNFHMLSGLLWLELKKEGTDKFDIKSLINRVNAMSSIHEQLYDADNISNINLKNYLKKIISNIPYENSKTKITQKVENIQVEFDHALSLGIITNEVFTNIIKHNKKTNSLNINITIKKEDKNIKLSIEDNGIGFDIQNVKKGLGLKLIEQFSRKLPNYSSKFLDEKATKYNLVFKV